MTLEAYSHFVRGQIGALQFAGRTCEDRWQCCLGSNRRKFRHIFQTDNKKCIHSSALIRTKPPNNVLNIRSKGRACTGDDGEGLVGTGRERGSHLADPLFQRDQSRFAIGSDGVGK